MDLFNLDNLEKKYQHTIWRKCIIKSRGNNYNFLLKVIEDAKCGKTITGLKGGKYYSCAKFIRNFYMEGKYKFKKVNMKRKEIWVYSCCRCFPKYCENSEYYRGLGCCESENNTPHHCCYSFILNKDKIRNEDLCYSDCCRFFEFKKCVGRFKYDLTWYENEKL